ncbi:hypothetical protein GCM10010420_14910 [Streptomyces glaucosporus]|uniref:Bacterial bifunctional deaminase-reductase C-terminal domain-containing protein n=1 Tax=Streptomyces glaucosporus TaxID=284044 RepID=A0ABP5V271_9ACTN
MREYPLGRSPAQEGHHRERIGGSSRLTGLRRAPGGRNAHRREEEAVPGDRSRGRPPRYRDLFRTDEIRQVGVHPLGRRLYETMLYWETADRDPSPDDSVLEWTVLWKPLPKVVFSTTPSAVQGHARQASGGLAEEVERWRAEPGEGDIAVGGATLAAEAVASDLIDEYRTMVHPVLVGGGIPFFARRESRMALELVETRTFGSGVVHLRHRVASRDRHRLPEGARAQPGERGRPGRLRRRDHKANRAAWNRVHSRRARQRWLGCWASKTSPCSRTAGCHRLHRRYERRAVHFLALTSIVCTLICYRRLTK